MLAFALKVFLLTSIASSERTRALSYPRMPMFVPKRLPRVLFLDEDDFGRGEIDLTDKRLPKINFEPDYKGNDRLYSIPTFYQGRFGRPYAPSFAFEQIQIAPPRNGFYPPTNGWKARSPRVVFPYNPDTSNSIHTNSHTAPSIDNVVFREQSIGTNDVAAEDQLQDISGDAFSERDAIVPHRAHKRIDERTKYYQTKTFILRKPMFVQKETTKRNFNEYPNATVPEFRPISDAQITKINEIMKDILSKPNYRKGKMLDSETSETRDIATELPEKDRKYDDGCPQGGTCEFFLSCWMKGGLLEGSCDGLLKSCCHKVAKSGLLGVQDLNSIESPFEGFSYGPVINDDIIKTFNVYKEKTLRSEKILEILDKSGLVTQRCELRNNGLTELMWSWQDIGRELELEYGDVQDDGCGVATSKQTAQRRIVGGDDAGFGTFPWQAYIRIGSSRCNMLMSIFELIGWKQCWIERCGGSLISRRHVVTAGHCVARAQPRHVRVTLGDYVINSAAEPLPAYTFGVRTIKVHPLFKFTPQADRFDVAVLTLDRNVHYMPHIAPICLPERGSDFLGQYGWAAGWGALSPGSRLRPRTLQAVDVPVLDNRVCERWHRANGINVVIYPEMLCAGYRGGGKDSCQGDSGGPLMLERAGRWYLIGVVSAGYSCASRGQPGIYHRVAHTVDWISHATTLA